MFKSSRPTPWGLVAFCILAPGIASADCAAPSGPLDSDGGLLAPPVAPDPTLKPVVPECLKGLSAPNQESCSADEITAYADAVDRYRAALQTYIAEADRYAAESVAFANAAIARAKEAQRFSDDAYAYAECEAGEVRAQTE